MLRGNDRLRWLLQDLRDNGSQGSWDWEADARFADALGLSEVAADASACCTSPSTSFARYNAHRMLVYRQATQPRLRLLRRAIRMGYIKAYWQGTGPGGANLFSVTRVRGYKLTTQGQAAIKDL